MSYSFDTDGWELFSTPFSTAPVRTAPNPSKQQAEWQQQRPSAVQQSKPAPTAKKYNKKHTASLPHISPHSLRHTFCSRMANIGMTPKALQYVIGHSNISMTLDYYTHISIDEIKEEMARFNV